MAGARHTAARDAFYKVVHQIVSTGCKRWQSKKDGWPRDWEARWAKGEVRPLKLAAFLKQECDEAAYRFWWNLERGSTRTDEIILKTPRAFEQFCLRMKRSSYFYPEELAVIEDHFKYQYWPIELAWIREVNHASSLEQLAKKMIGDVKPETALGSPDFHSDCITQLWRCYGRNDYIEAINMAEALCHVGRDVVRNSRDQGRQLATAELLTIAAFHGFVIANNCGDQRGFNMFSSIFNVSREIGITLEPSMAIFLAAPFISATKYSEHYGGPTLMTLSQLAWSLYCINLTTQMHLSKRTNQTDGSKISRLEAHFTISEIVKVSRALTVSGLEPSNVSGRHFYSMVQGLVPTLPYEAAREVSYWCRDVIHDPGMFYGEEYDGLEQFSYCDPIVASSIAIGIAATEANPEESLAWLYAARSSLLETRCHLGWSDFYSACADFMYSRGNLAMHGVALSRVREVQLAAGNYSKVRAIEQELTAHATVTPAMKSSIDGEQELIMFLLNVPPSLTND